MNISVEFFNASRSLIGLEYETLYMSDRLEENKKPIIEQHKVFSIGFLFLTIIISVNSGILDAELVEEE